MGIEMDFPWEGLLPATPAQAWDAITVNTGGWLWPIVYQPGVGGTERGLSPDGGVVTIWEPPARFATREDGENGWFNELSYHLEPRADGTYLRYLHRTVLIENIEVEADACRQHTAFYYHTLAEYLAHFAGQAATYASFDLPEGTGFAALERRLGIADDAAPGDRLRPRIPGLEPADATLDYLTPAFAGLRTDDALIRLFGRDTWGWPVGISLHLFAPADAAARTELAWRAAFAAPSG